MGSFAAGEIYGVTGRSLLLFALDRIARRLQPSEALPYNAGNRKPIRETLTRGGGGGATMSNVSDPGAAGWLAGGGEMGELIRAFDWSKTQIGPIENWSPPFA